MFRVGDFYAQAGLEARPQHPMDGPVVGALHTLRTLGCCPGEGGWCCHALGQIEPLHLVQEPMHMVQHRVRKVLSH